jgi:DNA-binding MarR family transcriptional regulator
MSKHSIDAFLEQVRTGELKNKTQRAYVALSGKSVSLQDLRKQTGIAHQTLTSSLSRLMDMGLVKQKPNGEFLHAETNERGFLSMQREQQRYLRWLKVGRDNKWIRVDGHANHPKPKKVVLSQQMSILDVL